MVKLKRKRQLLSDVAISYHDVGVQFSYHACRLAEPGVQIVKSYPGPEWYKSWERHGTFSERSRITERMTSLLSEYPDCHKIIATMLPWECMKAPDSMSEYNLGSSLVLAMRSASGRSWLICAVLRRWASSSLVLS